MSAYPNSLLNSLVGRIWMKLDEETKQHSVRVAKLAYCFAKEHKRNLDPDVLFVAGIWHDIGKLFVPRYILDFPGKLSSKDYRVVQQHAVWGASLSSCWNNDPVISAVVKHHHERYDGQGYPDGILNGQLPEEVRIISLCDTFDAMIHKRVYKPEIPESEVLKEIENQAEKQFDPYFTSLFVSWRKNRTFAELQECL